jgi:dienelactone hydrolase
MTGRVLAFGTGLFFSLALLTGAANANPANVFTAPELGGSIPCQTTGTGIRQCEGPGDATSKTVRTFDDTPIDVNFSMPSEADFGPPPYPTVMYFHGYGGSKEGFGGYHRRFNDLGYAAFSMTERGFKRSCGQPGPLAELAEGGEDCSKGFIHLMDTRFEVRDAQYLIGHLVDEGLVDPGKIASVGASYGGGKSMALAALRNRTMLGGLPGEQEGRLVPWTSPGGTPISLAAAAPIVPWTDIAYALMPNGRTLEYLLDQPYAGPKGGPANPIGVMKIGILNALYTSGDNYSGDGVGTDLRDERFDVPGWKEEMELGESYAARERASYVLDQMTRFHSSYYIDGSVQPAPLLIAQGYSDDLFPLSEATRFYNRTRARHPKAPLSMLFADVGHPRAPATGENAQGRPSDQEAGLQRVEAWLGYYVKGSGPRPANQVEVLTQVCPWEEPSQGPLSGSSWAAMSPGEIRLTDRPARVIGKDSNDSVAAARFGLLSDACSESRVDPEPGTVEYDFPTVPAGGYTLMGAPTIEADISVVNGSESQIAGKLFEVYPDGFHRLVARGVYRPNASGRQVFQLASNAYRFPPGVTPRLQLVAGDAIGTSPVSNFRLSNDQRDITISNVDLRLPVMEKPGSAQGQVRYPQPKTIPAGYRVSPDYRPSILKAKRARLGGKKLTLTVECPSSAYSCGTASIKVKGKVKGKSVAAGSRSGLTIVKGRSATLKITLSKAIRKALKGSRRGHKVQLTIQSKAKHVGQGNSKVRAPIKSKIR